MATAKHAKNRNENLKEALIERRRELLDHVRGRVRTERDQQRTGMRDSMDASDAHFQNEIDMALLEMEGATLSRIDEAITRLDAGQYGSCFECGEPIAEPRLRALPFAVRCRECEQERENRRGQARQAALRAASPFSHVASL